MTFERIVLATGGRFHYPELAVGLHRQGRLARFYTGYPPHKLPDELPRNLVDSWPWAIYLQFAGLRFAPRWYDLHRRSGRWCNTGMDRHVARTFPECDLFVALSGTSRLSGKVARERGVPHVCERSSMHIRWADDVLRREYAELGLDGEPTDVAMIAFEEEEYAEADLLLLPSNKAVSTFVERGVEPRRMAVAPIAPRSMPAVSPGPRPERFSALFVGELGVVKGVRYLAEAWRRAALDDAHLTLIGAPGRHTRRLLAPLDGSRHTRTGAIPHVDVINWMSRSHVIISPSLMDGHPLVVMEAMANGTVPIVSDGCGVAERIEDGVSGFIVPAGTVEPIAARLVELYSDRDRLDAMSHAARAVAQTYIDPRGYADRWLETIRDGLDRAGSR